MSVLEAVADRVSRGDVLSSEDGRALLATNDIIEIGALADSVRRQRHGARTTFVRVFETHVDAPASSLPGRISAGEIRIIGAPRDADSAVEAVRIAAAAAGTVPLTGFSLADLTSISAGLPDLTELCSRLSEAGLGAVAGVALDSLESPAAAVDATRRGGLAVLRMTVNAVENDEERMAAVQRARALQADVGGFRMFAPLPRTMSIALPTTGYDDVKLIALARLLADNIESIQVDWPLYGPKLAQVALTVGADDVDGIAAVDLGTLGTRRSPIEEIMGNIRAAALEPFERDGLFVPRSL